MPNDILAQYIPEPVHFLVGCQAWDHTRSEPCSVCKAGIRDGDDAVYCGKCDSVSPLRVKQIAKANAGSRIKAVRDEGGPCVPSDLGKRSKGSAVLTESHRRVLWMGYSKDGESSKNPNVVARVKAAREWLTAIGQEPDFSIKLDSRGRAVDPDT